MSYRQQSPTSPVKVVQGIDERDTVLYAELRAEWRRKQSDQDIRALAYEWKVGRCDDCTEDAWIEYQRRFGERANGPREEFTKKRRKMTAQKSPKRKPRAA